MEIILSGPRPNIILNRFNYSDESTIGDLNVDKGVFQCNTLEDTVRRVKKFGEPAIPNGIYRVILKKSPAFGFVPHILDVPYFTDIRIHNGNSPADTKGCIIVGQYNKSQKNWVGESRLTLAALMKVLTPMNEKEELWIEIMGGLSKEQMDPR